MPSWPLVVTLAGIGMVGSFISGLLGVGGAAFIIPMLLYGPTLLGTGHIEMKQAAGLSIVLVFAGSLSGYLTPRSNGAACPLCMRLLGPATAAGALAGGLASRWVSGTALSGLFGVLALAAGLLMLFPKPPGGDEVEPNALVSFNRGAGLAIAMVVGVVSGLVGAGGAFVLVPLMIYVLKIPTRVAMGSSLGIVFLSSLAGLVGKVLGGQIPWVMAAILVAGAVPGARIGVWFSDRVRATTLRYVLAIFTVMVAGRIWVDLLL